MIMNHALLPAGDHPYWTQAGDSLLDFYEKTMAINSNSFVHLYTAALPHLVKSGEAHVGVVSSMSGRQSDIWRQCSTELLLYIKE